MKPVALFVAAAATFALSAQAAETITCTMTRASSPKNSVSVTVDLNKLPDDGYISSDGLDVSKNDNLSFDLYVGKTAKGLELGATFYENKHVQDEVANTGWEVTTQELKASQGKAFVTEPLDMDGKRLAQFACVYSFDGASSKPSSGEQFVFKGPDSAEDNAVKEFEFAIKGDKLSVVDPEGDEHELDRSKRANESNLKFAVFADYGYDGYGGFIKVSVPQDILKGARAGKKFTAYYQQTVYSENGKHSETSVKGSCEAR